MGSVMNRSSSGDGAPGTAHLIPLTVLIFCLLVSAPACGSLDVNRYGEIVEASAVAANMTLPTGGAEVLDLPFETGDLAEGEAAEIAPETSAPERNESGALAEAVVYVFNKDDDKLSVSLFIDSELKDTKDVYKEKEVKFGTYPVEEGPHKLEISWWDDDTKKSYVEERVEEIYSEKAVTLYTTENKEPEEFEVRVLVRNENEDELDVYLYIDDEYEKQKEVKKKSTADLGKYDLEVGVHEFSVRWQDPETKIEYEKRKTVNVDGKDVVTFYAPKGVFFETEVEKPVTRTTSSSTYTTSRDDGISKSTIDEEKESPDRTEKDGYKSSSKPSGYESTTERRDTVPEGLERVDIDPNLYIVIIGTILVIYLVFFRR